MDKKFIENLYKVIKHGESLEEVSSRLGLSYEECYGAIELLKASGKTIEIEERDGVLKINKRGNYLKKNIRVKPELDSLIETKVCILSDTHLGTKESQPHLINKVYEEAYARGIDTVLHCGDLLDGDYTQIRREQIYQLFLRGFDEQVGYVIDNYPYVKGIKTYFIQGSHDETHLKNGGATPGYWISKTREDMIYLGQDNATITLNGVKIEMDHPGGGSSKALSYKPQQAIEGMSSGNKPKIFLQGHFHKYYYFFYRNVHAFLIPALCAQSQFMRKNKMANIMGAVFLDIYSDAKGNIQMLKTDELLFDESDVIEDDYKKCKVLVLK